MIVVLVVLVVLFAISKGGPFGDTTIAGASAAGGAMGPPAADSSGNSTPGSGCGGVGGFIENHVNRKNAIAPSVISAYTKIPGAIATPIAAVAGKLDVSAYAEKPIGNAVGSFLCAHGGVLGGAAAAAKFVGKEAVAGAEFVGSKAVAGFKALNNASQAPVSTGLGIVGKGLGAIAATNALSDRAATAINNHVPTPVKVALAPALVPLRVTATAVKDVAQAGQKVTGALSSGAKAGEHAVSSGVNKVLGWL